MGPRERVYQNPCIFIDLGPPWIARTGLSMTEYEDAPKLNPHFNGRLEKLSPTRRQRPLKKSSTLNQSLTRKRERNRNIRH